MTKLINMIGFKSGRLIVIDQAESKYGQSMWLCKCTCGNTCTYTGGSLRAGKVKSCGCLYKEVRQSIAYNSIAKEKHGASRSRLYYMWCSMKNRCYVKSSPSYEHYGARGITVCDEWRTDFMAFQSWSFANGYDQDAKRGECTLDRIDGDKGYSPDNCRWVSMQVQSNNRHNTCVMTFGKETHTTSEWAKISGVPRGTIYNRIKAGWPPEKVLSLNKYNPGKHFAGRY